MNARVAGKQDNDSSHSAFAKAKVASQKLYVAIPRESRARPRNVKTVMGLLPGIPGIEKATAVTGTRRALIMNHTFAPSVASVKVEEVFQAMLTKIYAWVKTGASVHDSSPGGVTPNWQRRPRHKLSGRSAGITPSMAELGTSKMSVIKMLGTDCIQLA